MIVVILAWLEEIAVVNFHRAILLWIGALAGSWFNFVSQPIMVVLLVWLMMHRNVDSMLEWLSCITQSIVEPRYYLQLRDMADRSSTKILCFQRMPLCGNNPLMPCYDESK